MTKKNRMMTGLICAAAAISLITGCGNSTSTGTAAKTDNGQAADGAYGMAYVVSVEDEWLGLLKDEVESKRQMLCVFLQRIPIGFLKI